LSGAKAGLEIGGCYLLKNRELVSWRRISADESMR